MPAVGRVLFVTWHGGGNVNPVVAIGQQLQELGHDVYVLGPRTLAERFAAAGLSVERYDAGTQWDTAEFAERVVDTIDTVDPAVVVVDYMLPAALCATEATGRRTVTLVHTLYGALLHDGTPAPMKIAASVREINDLREQLGLPAIDRLGELLTGTERILVVVPEVIDTPDPAAERVTYVGPVFESAGDDEGWTPPPGEGPLIVISLGTTDMDELPVLTTVLDALAHERARIVATVGAHADPSTIPTHANATVGPFVHHAAVLPHADLVISHGGIGTALAAMAHGLPVLFLPLGRDQPVNAAAIAATGAAIVLSPTASPGQIARAVEELLTDPAYRQAAARVGAMIPSAGEQHPATRLLDGLIAGED